MKMLLTSNGFENPVLEKKFIELVVSAEKPITEVKILFIPTAARTEEELAYVDKSFQELINMGFKFGKIARFDLDRVLDFYEIKDYDVIYVCGGNTFHLLKKMRESKFGIVLGRFLELNKLYVGVSAGSIVVGPNIDVATPFDANDSCISDTTGLGFVNASISPHYTDKDKPTIDKIAKEVKYQIVRLKDNQAFLVLGDDKRVLE